MHFNPHSFLPLLPPSLTSLRSILGNVVHSPPTEKEGAGENLKRTKAVYTSARMREFSSFGHALCMLGIVVPPSSYVDTR